jgi:hypothetical protein
MPTPALSSGRRLICAMSREGIDEWNSPQKLRFDF